MVDKTLPLWLTPHMKNKAAVELGRLGGLVASEKQREAARRNGKKGGRPRKVKEAPVK